MILPFEHICYLHTIDQVERMQRFLQNREDVGIENKVDFRHTSRMKISDKLETIIPTLRTVYYDGYKEYDPYIYNKVYNCAIAHYDCIKVMYTAGFDNILILEDDACFINNAELIEQTLNQLPTDYELIKLYASFYRYPEDSKPGFHNPPVNPLENDWICSTCAYVLSNAGMKRALSVYENIGIMPSDMVFQHFTDNSKVWMTNHKLVEPQGGSIIVPGQALNLH